MSRFFSKWLYRGMSFVENPKAMLLRRKGVISDIYLRLDQPWIHDLKISTVIDIGANVGRFSKTMEYLFPEAQILAFEPLPSCHEKALKLMNGYKRFKGYNIGLGDSDSVMEMEECVYNPSSSLLPMSQLHKDAFPFTDGGKKKKVLVKKLDDVIKDEHLKNNILIKVDVQGYEKFVIDGGIETFKMAKILMLELSFQELYQGQPLFDEIYSLIKPLGFRFYGNMDLMKHPKSKMPLDADCIFINEGV